MCGTKAEGVTVFKFPEPKDYDKSSEYNKLRSLYSYAFLSYYESSEAKIRNFYDKVLPCLAFQECDFSKSPSSKWICLFDFCHRKRASFSSKQSYCRHVVTQHDIDLPGGCYFLMPNSAYFKIGGFQCDICRVHFCRLDHYNQHKKKEVHCRFAGYISIKYNAPRDVQLSIEDNIAPSLEDLRSNYYANRQTEINSSRDVLSIKWHEDWHCEIEKTLIINSSSHYECHNRHPSNASYVVVCSSDDDCVIPKTTPVLKQNHSNLDDYELDTSRIVLPKSSTLNNLLRDEELVSDSILNLSFVDGEKPTQSKLKRELSSLESLCDKKKVKVVSSVPENSSEDEDFLKFLNTF